MWDNPVYYRKHYSLGRECVRAEKGLSRNSTCGFLLSAFDCGYDVNSCSIPSALFSWQGWALIWKCNPGRLFLLVLLCVSLSPQQKWSQSSVPFMWCIANWIFSSKCIVLDPTGIWVEDIFPSACTLSLKYQRLLRTETNDKFLSNHLTQSSRYRAWSCILLFWEKEKRKCFFCTYLTKDFSFSSLWVHRQSF